jgi:hypothetical protein
VGVGSVRAALRGPVLLAQRAPDRRSAATRCRRPADSVGETDIVPCSQTGVGGEIGTVSEEPFGSVIFSF